MDQSGISFAKMVGRCLRKVIDSSGQTLTEKAIRTRGNLEGVAVMPVVTASGNTYSQVVVYPGTQAHYRKVRGQVQTVQQFLPKCYFYQREMPGVDSRIIYDWAQKFLEDTAELRKKSQYILLLTDGYGAHVQFNTLQLMKENRVIVIAMPAHTSHRLQPLDVSVFSAYKSYIQKEIHTMAKCKTILDAFDIAICIRNAYSSSHTTVNIVSGFYRSGAWDEQLLDATIDLLRWLFSISKLEENKENVTLEMLLKSYARKARSLLRDADVEEKVTVRIKTTTGCNFTSDAVLNALQLRQDKRRRLNRNKSDIENIKGDYKEPKADVAHLLSLSSEREVRRKLLDESRSERRFNQKLRMKRKLLKQYDSCQGPLGIPEEQEED